MKITKINSNTNFKSINKVIVPKKLFENPNDDNECTDIFKEMVVQKSSDYFDFKISQILGYMTKPQNYAKSFVIFETPGYETIKRGQKDTSINYSIEWLENNSKTTLARAESEDEHTFYILTGKDKDLAVKELLGKEYEKMAKKAGKSVEPVGDENITIMKGLAKLAELLDEKFRKIINNKQIKTWKIENSEELEDTVDKILKED